MSEEIIVNLIEIHKSKPEIVEKSWGREIVFANNEHENYCGKILEIRKGEGFDFHLHRYKHEKFYCLQGKLEVFLIDTQNRKKHVGLLKKDDCLEIPQMLPHSVKALEDTILLEASSFHEDSDSYRV